MNCSEKKNSKDMVEKIQKLLNKAEGTNNEAEAQIFFNKAQQLMAQYDVKMSELNIDDEAKVEEVTVIDSRGNSARNLRLAKIVAKNFKCEVIKCNNTIVFLGLEKDIKIATITFKTIHKFMEKRRRKVYNDAKKQGLPTKGIREDYVQGFLTGLAQGFKRNVEENALVVVVPQEVTDHLMDITKGKTVPIKSSYRHSSLYHKGYQDGCGYNHEIE